MPLSVQGTTVFVTDVDMAGYFHRYFESGGVILLQVADMVLTFLTSFPLGIGCTCHNQYM